MPNPIENLIVIKLNYKDLETEEIGETIGLINLNETKNWVGSIGDAK